jgi:hypothetical protein
MRKIFTIFLMQLLLCVQVHQAFSQSKTTFNLDGAGPRSFGNTMLHGLIGTVEALLPSGFLMIYNFGILHSGWALPNADSARENLTVPWLWRWEPTDGFKVNNIAHPYQGSISFNAGRVNGFNFYESAFFSGLSSYLWESVGESQEASLNDFIVTTIGAMSVGEILYRLYWEAYSAGVPAILRALINPMAGLHHLLTGSTPYNAGGHIYQFQAFLGAGYATAVSRISFDNRELPSFKGFIGDMGFYCIYGDPFEQESSVPFNHFEVYFQMGYGPPVGYMGHRVLTDAYLFSFCPVFTDNDKMSTGLSLQFDFVSQGVFDAFNSTIDQFSNALDWTIKYQHLFSGGAVFEEKIHAGFTFMGVSNYYSPNYYSDYRGRLLKNYGYGFNIKNFSSIEHEVLGKFELGILYYVMWSYPETSALSPQAFINWVFLDVTYSHPITKRLSIGINNSFSCEMGTFKGSGFPDTRNTNNVVKLFVLWNF